MGYDAAGRLTNRWTPAKGNTGYAYDVVGNLTNVDDALGQLVAASGRDSGGMNQRAHEQLGYGFDPAGNLAWRTNSGLVEQLTVNNLNELSGFSRNSGTLTVAGATTKAAASVSVNGLGANVYPDFTFALDGFTVADGTNPFTAVASDGLGRWDTNTVVVNLPFSVGFAYDANGNITPRDVWLVAWQVCITA